MTPSTDPDERDCRIRLLPQVTTPNISGRGKKHVAMSCRVVFETVDVLNRRPRLGWSGRVDRSTARGWQRHPSVDYFQKYTGIILLGISDCGV